MPSLAQRLAEIKKGILAASENRSVAVIAVTKGQPVEKVKEAIGAGLTLLAVNYVQEGETLRQSLKSDCDAALEWHFIGHIQSRKVRNLLEYHCIESLDRLELAEELNSRLAKRADDQIMRVLVEVNIGREAQKSGVLPEALPQFLNELRQFSRLKVEGLMGMPPALNPVEQRRPYFKELFQLFQNHQATHHLSVLSMGTSEDYLIGVEEGATMVRLGTSLFGPRT